VTSEELAQQVAEQAMEQGLTVATAESLTSGQVAARLGAAPSASRIACRFWTLVCSRLPA